MLCTKIVLNVKTKQKQQSVYTTCSACTLSFSWTMNNLLSYCGLVDAKIRASDKDLPVLTDCPTFFSGFRIKHVKKCKKISLKTTQPLFRIEGFPNSRARPGHNMEPGLHSRQSQLCTIAHRASLAQSGTQKNHLRHARFLPLPHSRLAALTMLQHESDQRHSWLLLWHMY